MDLRRASTIAVARLPRRYDIVASRPISLARQAGHIAILAFDASPAPAATPTMISAGRRYGLLTRASGRAAAQLRFARRRSRPRFRHFAHSGRPRLRGAGRHMARSAAGAELPAFLMPATKARSSGLLRAHDRRYRSAPGRDIDSGRHHYAASAGSCLIMSNTGPRACHEAAS